MRVSHGHAYLKQGQQCHASHQSLRKNRSHMNGTLQPLPHMPSDEILLTTWWPLQSPVPGEVGVLGLSLRTEAILVLAWFVNSVVISRPSQHPACSGKRHGWHTVLRVYIHGLQVTRGHWDKRCFLCLTLAASLGYQLNSLGTFTDDMMCHPPTSDFCWTWISPKTQTQEDPPNILSYTSELGSQGSCYQLASEVTDGVLILAEMENDMWWCLATFWHDIRYFLGKAPIDVTLSSSNSRCGWLNVGRSLVSHIGRRVWCICQVCLWVLAPFVAWIHWNAPSSGLNMESGNCVLMPQIVRIQINSWWVDTQGILYYPTKPLTLLVLGPLPCLNRFWLL